MWYQSGKLKRRIRPSDVTINIGKKAPIPECPIPGERFCSSWSPIRKQNNSFTFRYLKDDAFVLYLFLGAFHINQFLFKLTRVTAGKK